MLKTLSSATKTPVHLALATSSHAINFKLKSAHLSHIFCHFPLKNRVLGDDPRIPQGRGKPAPDIYLVALETINADIRAKGVEKEITPEECLVFEDSVLGVEAGRRAGMRVIWCPHPELLKLYKGKEREVLAGLAGTMTEDNSGKGKPGSLDDGWAELLSTLLDFPFEKYGIEAEECH